MSFIFQMIDTSESFGIINRKMHNLSKYFEEKYFPISSFVCVYCGQVEYSSTWFSSPMEEFPAMSSFDSYETLHTLNHGFKTTFNNFRNIDD